MPDRASVYKILALAPFIPKQTTVWEKAPQTIDRYTIDEAIQTMHINLFLPLEPSLCPAGGIDFHFDNLKSMHPDGIAKHNPYFKQLIQAQTFIFDARANGLSASEIRQGLHQWPDLPTIQVHEEISQDKQSAKSSLDNILDMIAISSSDKTPPEPRQMGETNQLEQIVQKLLDALFSDPAFQRMEGAWRGLRLLLQQRESDGTNVQVSIASVHAETINESLNALTPHLINNLPNVILLDLPFDNSPLSIERLFAVAQWAATLMVPVITWTPPAFLKISTWDDIRTLSYIPNHLDSAEYAKFVNLQNSHDGQWLCLLCNRFLIRYPYGQDNRPRHVRFNEHDLPWISPVWALGSLIKQSVDKSGWPTHMADIRQFQILDLAFQNSKSAAPTVTESCFDRDRLDQMVRSGICPLTTEVGRDVAFFPKLVTIDGTRLSFQLLLSQTTQFLLWCKDHLVAETNPTELKNQLDQAFQLFSDQSSPSGFEDIDIVVKPADSKGNLPVHISLSPHPSIQAGQNKIELQIDW